MARMSELIAAHPEDRRLRRQQLLLGRAQIGDSFVLPGADPRHFQALGIRVERAADERELCTAHARAMHRAISVRRRGRRVFTACRAVKRRRDDRRVFDTLFLAL